MLIFFIGSHTVVVEVLVETQTTPIEPKPDIMPAQSHGIAVAPTPFKDEAVAQDNKDENEADHGSSNLPISRMKQTVSDCDYNTSTEGSSIGNIDSSGTMECKSTEY